MPASDIVVKGAREHNLRDVDLVLPRNKLVCLTGVSGSGKSSLAFDTLYAEGQRRYVESLSTFARQFLGQMPKPDVDHISGLSPSISISQKIVGAKSALDRRHGHRDLRLSAGALCPHRPRALPEVQPADHGPEPRADHRADHDLARRDAVSRPGAADPSTKGGIPRSVRRFAQAGLFAGHGSTAASCS